MRGAALQAVAAQVAEGPEDVVTKVGGWSDNRGNKFALNHLMSTRYPLCVIMMELAAVMVKGGRHNAISQRGSEGVKHHEADDLSSMNMEAFDPWMRLDFDPQSHKLEVMRDYQGCAKQARTTFLG
ncbi:hypothetical protein N9L68_07330, partial [bacterium]|nr:hypothetical protein [bacterium]